MKFRHLAGDIAVLERNALEISERQMLPIAGYRCFEVFVDRVLISHIEVEYEWRECICDANLIKKMQKWA